LREHIERTSRVGHQTGGMEEELIDMAMSYYGTNQVYTGVEDYAQ
jgi:hypothetical protein